MDQVALAKARRLVTPDGLVVVIVPNPASWQARLARDDWHHLGVPEHLFHFTPVALTRMLTGAGLTTVRLSHWSFDYGPYGWLQSVLNRAGGRWRTLDARLRWSAGPRPRLDRGSIEAWARPS